MRGVRKLRRYHPRIETISTESPAPSKGFSAIGYILTFTMLSECSVFPDDSSAGVVLRMAATSTRYR